MDKSAVVIFARAPRPGRVKTRLVPPLTARQALALHVACLQSTAAHVASLPRTIHKYIYFTGLPTPARREARRLRLPATLRVRTQGRGHLGARLERMFTQLCAAGYERVVVIGSDSPTLPRAWLLEALAALRRVEVVIGPAEDGGYYLLGCRQLRFRHSDMRRLPEIFRGIPWGTTKTFARTLARLRRARRFRYRVLPRWYDVDRPTDMVRLEREVARSRNSHLTPLKTFFTR